jgi:hypothetical protein
MLPHEKAAKKKIKFMALIQQPRIQRLLTEQQEKQY